MRRFRARTVLIGLFWVVLMLAFAASLIPESPYLRFQLLRSTGQGEAQWIYERIHFDKRPIDVAIIGASNMQLGLSSTRLKDNLASQGVSVNVENFAMLFGGRNLNYVIAKELFEAGRQPKLLIIGLTARPTHFGNPGFRYLATRRELLQAIYAINLNYFADLKYLPFRQLKLAAMALVPEMFGVTSAFQAGPASPQQYDPAISDESTWGERLERGRSLPPDVLADLASQQEWDRPLLPSFLADFEFGDETFYLPKIVELARRHGTSVVFLYIPDFHGPARSLRQEMYLRLGPVISADFVRTHQELYYDLTHLNRGGALAISDWVTEYVLTILQQRAISQMERRWRP